jgi:hypothetical protein
MSLVTSGAKTWTAHTHRNHHGGGSTWLFGPEGPSNVTGPDPFTAPSQFGSYSFLFCSAAGAEGGGLAYPPGELTPTSPVPSFPAGDDPGSVIAWYVAIGNGNGGPALFFDAFSETAGDWIDWDHSNDPFTVTSGTRGAPPDDDDTVSTNNGPGTVTAAHFFPGTDLVFDQWLLFSADAHTGGTGNEQVTEDQGKSGVAVAVYREPGSPGWRLGRQYVAYDPFWWLKNSPVEVERTILGLQSEATQISSLIDLSSAVSDQRIRALVQRGMYESLISIANRQLGAQKGLVGQEGA